MPTKNPYGEQGSIGPISNTLPIQIGKAIVQAADPGCRLFLNDFGILDRLQDRPLQAQRLPDYMIALFSEPSVQDVILWRFWAKHHWRSLAALYDEQWNARPVRPDLDRSHSSTVDYRSYPRYKRRRYGGYPRLLRNL